MITSLRLLLDGFSVLLILTILVSTSRQKESRLFRWMLVLAMAQLVFEGMIAATVETPGGRPIATIVQALFFLNHPVVPLLYSYYVVRQVRGPSRRQPRWLPWLLAPALVSGALSLLSVVGGQFFRWNGSQFVRGPWFWAFALLTTLYMLFVLGYLLAHRRTMAARRFRALLSFPLLPTAGGILEAFFPAFPVTWPLMALSLQLLFLTVQQSKLTLDYLTECRNRRGLDEYLAARVREARDRHKVFAGFLADVDCFKSINDRFGHAEGDRALIRTAKLLKSCLRTEDFLARFAGDEFVAILPGVSTDELRAIVDRVERQFASHRPKGGYLLSVSLGADVYRPDADLDADAYLKRLDALMYQEKERRKLGPRD